MGSRLISALPVIVLVIAAAGLSVLGARSISAERAAAERQARTQLRERATAGAAQLTAAARVAIERASLAAEGGDAMLVAGGRFLRPVEPVALEPLLLPPGGDPEGELYLSEARRVEGDDGQRERAEGLYRAAAGARRAPDCRALARLRHAALLRRLGEAAAADALLEDMLLELPDELARTREAMMARALLARPQDTALESDLLACVGGGDEPLALALLEQAGSRDDVALRARRRELEEIDQVRATVDLARLPDGEARVSGGVILGFARLADEDPTAGPVTAIVRATVPDLPGGVAVLGRDRAEDSLAETAPAGLELPGVQVVARMPRAELESEVRRRRLWLGSLLVVLLAGGAIAGAATLRALRREAEAVGARAELLARVGHDLRTPLALIRMYGETLAAGKVTDPDQAREFAAIIARESERLSAEVATVLDLTRVGARALAPTLTDVAALAAQVAESHRPLLEAEGMRLEVVADREGASLLVMADEAALRGAIGNLLDNARRYASSGREVRIATAATDGRVLVRVADRGAGIPAGSERQIFERFTRAPGATGRGTGLGLALVREVAEAHGGGAAARSREGGGAEVELWLPRAETTA